MSDEIVFDIHMSESEAHLLARTLMRGYMLAQVETSEGCFSERQKAAKFLFNLATMLESLIMVSHKKDRS